MGSLTMRSILTLILAAAVCSAHSSAQAQGSGDARRARFDVISIKPNVSGTRAVSVRNRGWQYVARNVSVMNLLVSAYDVAPQQVLNAPDWVRTEKFDIEAKILDADPASVPLDRTALLRNLIADRFRAVIRGTATESTGFALVLDRPDGRLGPQLKRSTLDCGSRDSTGESPCRIRGDAGVIRGAGVPMTQLISFLSQRSNLLIRDDTGLEGLFEFTLEWTPAQLSPLGGDVTALDSLPARADVFTAVREQLGLRLEPEGVELAAIFVEHIERPTPN